MSYSTRTSTKLGLYDGTRARVCELNEEQAKILITARMATPIGRHRVRGLLLEVDYSIALPLIRGIKYTKHPLNQGSQTFRRVLIADKPVYEHNQGRCAGYRFGWDSKSRKRIRSIIN